MLLDRIMWNKVIFFNIYIAFELLLNTQTIENEK